MEKNYPQNFYDKIKQLSKILMEVLFIKNIVMQKKSSIH
jgi:hypothetical protein